MKIVFTYLTRASDGHHWRHYLESGHLASSRTRLSAEYLEAVDRVHPSVLRGEDV